ncbi:hypothetical protein GOBAR_AA03099 [Gossypium barbadense]|uniref:Uncharacterized protein n=1 Tax=Gossypium barbadense TaxID=3634 RepID=A0A2P5YPE6_GOSBA|nr:hypothetical protein GOBAR_AA03099 [Gossypium barbadense]
MSYSQGRGRSEQGQTRSCDKAMCTNMPKVGDKVLLDAADPHIVTTKPNKEVPLTVFSIFPFGTIEVSHPKFDTFKVNNTRLKPYFDENDSRNEEFPTQTRPSTRVCLRPSENRAKISPTLAMINRHGNQEDLFQILWARPLGVGCCIDWTVLEQVQLADDVQALLTTDPSDLFFAIIELTFLELTLELCSTFHVQDVMTNFDDPRIVQFRLGSLVRQLSIPEFDPEDITNDVPPHHEDPPSQPPPPSHPVHAATLYADISECLTRFEQQCFQRFDHIDAALYYKELQSSPLLRNLKLHWKRFSTTTMSCLTTTIATTRYNILLVQDLWTNEPPPPPEYPPPPSR